VQTYSTQISAWNGRRDVKFSNRCHEAMGCQRLLPVSMTNFCHPDKRSSKNGLPGAAKKIIPIYSVAKNSH